MSTKARETKKKPWCKQPGPWQVGAASQEIIWKHGAASDRCVFVGNDLLGRESSFLVLNTTRVSGRLCGSSEKKPGSSCWGKVLTILGSVASSP